jgi:flagellar basal-body rod modification protein FlgD
MTSSTSASLAITSQEQFLQLLVAQLQNQDPLDPVSDTEFVAQLAQFSSLQSLQTLNANFEQMLKLQQIGQGADLIGRRVEYSPDGTSSTLTGVVDRLSVNDGTISLQIGSNSVPLNNLRTVLN